MYFSRFCAGSTYHYLGAEPKRRPDGWNRSATSAGSMPTAISISATGSPT